MSNTSGGLLAYGSSSCLLLFLDCHVHHGAEKQHNTFLRELSLALKNLASTLTSDEVTRYRLFLLLLTWRTAARVGGAAERVD